MKIIYKYPIRYNPDKNTLYIKVPKGAEVISTVGLSLDMLEGFIYAIVDPELEPTVEREVLLLGTGIPLMEEQEEKVLRYQFLGTHQDGPYIWHIWVEYEGIDLTEIFGNIFDLDFDATDGKL